MRLTPELDLPSGENSLVESLMMGGWAMLDNYISDRMVDSLIDEFRQMEQRQLFSPAAIGTAAAKQIRSEIRSDQIAWIDPHHCLPAQHQYLQMMERLRVDLNRQLFLGLLDLEAHCAIYQPGSGYARHWDNFQGENQRILTVVLYLNKDWRSANGGEIRFYFDGEEESGFMDVPPQAGRLLAFFSHRFPHEVLPVRSERLSITGWFRQRD